MENCCDLVHLVICRWRLVIRNLQVKTIDAKDGMPDEVRPALASLSFVGNNLQGVSMVMSKRDEKLHGNIRFEGFFGE